MRLQFQLVTVIVRLDDFRSLSWLYLPVGGNFRLRVVRVRRWRNRRVQQRLDESDVIQEMYLRLNHSAKIDEVASFDGTTNCDSEDIDCTVPIG